MKPLRATWSCKNGLAVWMRRGLMMGSCLFWSSPGLWWAKVTAVKLVSQSSSAWSGCSPLVSSGLLGSLSRESKDCTDISSLECSSRVWPRHSCRDKACIADTRVTFYLLRGIKGALKLQQQLGAHLLPAINSFAWALEGAAEGWSGISITGDAPGVRLNAHLSGMG